MKLREIIGWYGTVSIILAYFLNSFHVLASNNILYQLLNLTGAIGILIISFYKKIYQPAILNSIWAVIALMTIILNLFKVQ